MKALLIFCAAAMLAGCTSWRLQTLRSTRFVDDEGNFIHVDYCHDTEEHKSTFTLDNGVRLPYSSRNALRVEMPDGTKFIAYQHLVPVGTMYKTEDSKWEFFESGAGCIVAQLDKDGSGYIPFFRGTLCATVRDPVTDKDLKQKRERNERWRMNPDARLETSTNTTKSPTNATKNPTNTTNP